MNLYGFAGGDPVNFSDPMGLSPDDCLTLPVPCSVLLPAAAVASVPLLVFGAAVVVVAGADAALGSSGGAVGAVSTTAARDATAVFNRKEGKQIRSAIKTATGQNATTGQYNCMSQHIHECKDHGDGGSKNKKGDFTMDELVTMAKELFGKNP